MTTYGSRSASGTRGKVVEFGQPDRAVGALDVAQDTVGTDRGESLIITDQPDAATAADDELDGGVQGECVGHPRAAHTGNTLAAQSSASQPACVTG
jgi:hypothetical protein